MAITYGGIALSLSTAELDALQNHYMRRDQVEEFEGTYQSPPNLQFNPFSYAKPPELKQLGRLVWPKGAAKFAFAHFAVSDRILQLIRAQAYAGDTLNALALVLTDDSGREVSTDMTMLPARPISQVTTPGTSGGNLWMITLVDDRYYWWMRAYDIVIDEGTTTWADLYAQIASGLLISLTPDTVNANYGTPTRRFACYDQPLPVLLDQVAYSCGQRVIRNLDGTVVTQNYTTAKTVFDANWSGLTNRGFGGRMHTIGESGASGDMFALVPEAVRCVFPNEIIETGVISDVYEIDNTLTGLAISQYPAIVTGFTGTQVFWGDQIAQTHASGGLPTNLSALTNYAAQASKDWYLWQLGGVDVVYSGVDAWQPDGITDTIEILYEEERLLTRVQREPWNDRAGGGVQTNVAAASGGGGGGGGLGVYGQANSNPALPGYGIRETINISQVSLGSPINDDNLDIQIADDPGSDRLQYTIENLGVFAQADGGTVVGPEPMVNIERVIPASLLTNLEITATDVPANLAVKFEIDNLGIYGRVNYVTTSYEYSSLTSTPPSSGETRMDSATFSAITSMYMSKLDRYGNTNTLATAIATSRELRIADESTPATYGNLLINSVTDSGSYYTYDVTPIFGGSLTTSGSNVLVNLPIIESDTYGPRRRVNMVSYDGILVGIQDSLDNDELIFTFVLDYPSINYDDLLLYLPKGPDYAVLGYDTTDPIRFRDDPQVVTLIARSGVTVGVASTINGYLDFKNSAGTVSFKLQAPGITEQQTISMPSLAPTAINQMLMIDDLPGGDIYSSSWLGMYAKTQVYSAQTITGAGIQNWRHIWFTYDLFETREETSPGYTSPLIDLKSGSAYSVLWTNTGGVRPAWTDSPVVNNLKARNVLEVGDPSTIRGKIKLYHAVNSGYAALQCASPVLADQLITFPDGMPSAVKSLLWVSDLPGAPEIDTAWVKHTTLVGEGGGHDWHWWKDVAATNWFYNPWPVEYPTRNGNEYTGYDPYAGFPVPPYNHNTAIDTGLIVSVPYLETRGGTLQYIGVYVGTPSNNSGGQIQIGIYQNASVGSTLEPDLLLIDAGTLTIDTAGLHYVACSATLSPGLYWLTIRLDNDSMNIPFIAGYGAGELETWAPFGVLATTTTTTGDGLLGANKNWPRGWYAWNQGGLAALPSSFPSSDTLTLKKDAEIPLIFVHYAS